MGEVWRARQDGLSAPVAVKLLQADPARREDRARAFLVEAQSVAALDHPHIVSILDFGLLTEEEAQGVGLWPGCPWMAAELLTGGSLRERQPAGWPELRGWLEALLDALAHAHARGLIHRDLKPDNVLFDDAGVLRVVDFGLVLQLDKAGTEAPFSGGTPVAMAPEQLSGDWRRQGPWTDLYALGCLGWRLATGRWPHEAAGLPALAAAHAAGRLPPFVPRLALPDGVEAWLRALLRPAARERPASAALAASTLPGLSLRGPAWLPGVAAPGPSPRLATASTLSPDDSRWLDSAPWLPPAPEQSPSAPPTLLPLPPPADWRGALSPRRPGGAAGLSPFRQPPLVGRESLQDGLWQALRAVIGEGRPLGLRLLGPPGIGKSALARWLVQRAAELGVAGAAAAQHNGQLGPEAGVGGLLRRALRAEGLHGASLQQRAAEARMDGELQERPDDLCAALTDPEAAGLRVAIAARLLRNRAPSILWIDDLDGAQEAAALALALLDGPEAPVLVLITDGQGGLALPTVQALRVHPASRDLELPPLHRGALARLLDEHLDLESEALAAVVEAAAGNPARALAQARRLGADARDLDPATLAAADPVALWRPRLQALLPHPPDRLALGVAAVLGTRVEAPRWAAALSALGQRLSPTLWARLVKAGLARAWADGGWSWVDEAARTAAKALIQSRLPDVNAACAQVLEGEPDVALRLRRAQHLRAARQPEVAWALLVTCANGLIYRGDRAAAARLCATAAGLCDDLGLPPGSAQRARILLWRARAARVDEEPGPGLALAIQAAELSPQDPDIALAALQIRVQCLIDLERLDEAVALSRGRTEPLLMAFGALALASSGRLDEARVQLDALGPTSFIGAFLRGILPLEEGDLEAADQGLAQAIAFAERGGSPLNAASFMRLRAQCLRQQGRMDEAQDLAQAALLTLERLGSPWVYEIWTELALQAALRGDGPGARLAAARVLRVRPGPGQAVRRRLVQAALLLVAAEAGEDGAVEAWLRRPEEGRPKLAETRDLRTLLARALAAAAPALRPGIQARLDGLPS